MSLSLLNQAFANQRHYASPFLVLGDPTPELSVQLCIDTIDAGAGMLELGIPYSDPCADGPAVQDACRRAFQAGVDVDTARHVLTAVHRARPNVAKNLLVYGNLVHAPGVATFCQQFAAAGASSLLVPDIPLEEAGSLRAACAANDLGHVQLIAPQTDATRLQELVDGATGFVYLAGYQGVTGRQSAADTATDRSALLRSVVNVSSLPVCLGFGLSKPQQLLHAFEQGVQLCVVGSHLCRAIGEAWNQGDASNQQVRDALLSAWQPLAATTSSFTTP